MAFPRKLLNEGEELVLDLRPHWLAVAPATFLLLVAVVVGLWAGLFLHHDSTLDDVVMVAALIFLAGSLVYFGTRYAVWVNTMFVLTSDRLLTRRGVLSKSGTEIPLERINTVFFSQSLFERIVGAGDLTIESAGERGSESFDDVRKPALVQREIYVQIENNENRKYDRIGVGNAAPSLSVAEQLEKLHALAQQGALTSEQYESEKAKLLGA